MDLEEAVRELAPRLLRYSMGWTRERGLAEDIVQDTLVALIRRWQEIGPPDSAEAFVFAVARRKAYRAVVRRRLFQPLMTILDRHHPDADPEEATVAKAEMQRVQCALAALPARDREALLLIAAGELGMADAATILGISVSAVKMRLLRARQRLAAILESEHAG